METETRITYYENNKVKYERSYRNGVRHGEQKWLNEDGSPYALYHFKNGIEYGTSTIFRSSKNIDTIKQWRNYFLHGPRLRFIYLKNRFNT
jgi:antitoxin component YwqK of YwqJK toxin-antitoxin module